MKEDPQRGSRRTRNKHDARCLLPRHDCDCDDAREHAWPQYHRDRGAERCYSVVGHDGSRTEVRANFYHGPTLRLLLLNVSRCTCGNVRRADTSERTVGERVVAYEHAPLCCVRRRQSVYSTSEYAQPALIIPLFIHEEDGPADVVPMYTPECLVAVHMRGRHS